MRWFFRYFDIVVYRKSVMETLFSQIHVTEHDVGSRVLLRQQDGAGMARYVWTGEETEVFLYLIKEKNITAILDSKQQRNAYSLQ